jgi:D-tyrosyl-tRNA(Tyr) deacylase
MRLVVQRVSETSVSIDNRMVSKIMSGLLVFVAFERNDSDVEIDFLIKRLLVSGFFENNLGQLGSSVVDTQKEILVVSQFTLYGRLDKGRKPDFSRAMPPNQARILFDRFVSKLKAQYARVATGVFAANMQVSLVNDGPVTFILEKNNLINN